MNKTLHDPDFDMSLDYQRLKLKIIFAATLLVISGSLVLVVSILSGGSSFNALLILLGFGIFYAYETNKRFKRLASHPPLEHPEILGMVRKLSKKGNIQEPKVLVEDEPVINAYALSTPGGSYIILPEGIINAFDSGIISKTEMEAILAHELGHIINRDSFISAGLYFTTRLFVVILTTLEKIKPYLSRIAKKSAETTQRLEWDSFTGIMMLAFTLFLFMLLLFVAVSSISLFILISICVFSINFLGRQQEHVADLISASLTEKPGAMSEALHNIHKLDLLDIPSSELSPYQSALLNGTYMELTGRKLTFRERLDEYKSTHPNLINRINILLTPKNLSKPLVFIGDRINALDLMSLELKELPVIMIWKKEIPLSVSLYHGVFLGIFSGIISSVLGILEVPSQVNYVLLVLAAVWIGIFSLSRSYPSKYPFNLYSTDAMLTLIFIFTLTFSFFTSIAAGVLVFYGTIVLSIILMVPVSILSAITMTYFRKRQGIKGGHG
ncbi:MAG: M48 family metalloprotease [Methanolobus sp.]|nr:M48 family metalloprotease [Methanolobus sp.]